MEYYLMLIIKRKNKIYIEYSSKDNKYYFPCCRLKEKVENKDFLPIGLYISFLKPDYNFSYPYKDIVINNITFTLLQLDLNYNVDKLRDNISYLWIPNYYLNKNYFDEASKLFINLYNYYNPIEDIPISARILFSKAYLNNHIDMYDYIISFTNYCFKNKYKLDIYSEEEYIKVLIYDRLHDKFFKANKDICISAAKMYYEIHDRVIKEI